MEVNYVWVVILGFFFKENCVMLDLKFLLWNYFFFLLGGKVILGYGICGGYSGDDIKICVCDMICVVFDGVVCMVKFYGVYGNVIVI